MKKQNNTPSYNFTAQFFYWCSGANRSIIEECPESERQLKAGIGATVLFTALFATLASSFACFMIFHHYIWAIGFGLLWGAMIFNLDRLIVGGMNPHQNYFFKIASLLIRVMMATVISVVIAKPLELRIFADRISYEILAMKNLATAEQSKHLEGKHQIGRLKQKGQGLATKLKQLEGQKQERPTSASFIQLDQDWRNCNRGLQQLEKENGRKIARLQGQINTIYHTRSNFEQVGDERHFKETKLRAQYYALIAERNQLKKELKQSSTACKKLDQQVKTALLQHQGLLEQQIIRQRARHQQWEAEQHTTHQVLNQEKAQVGKIISHSFKEGLITQLEAMRKLVEKDKSLRHTAHFIMLLFWIIELAPVLIKLISTTPQYDLLEKYEANRHKLHLAHEKKIEQTVYEKEQRFHQEEVTSQLQQQLLQLNFSTFAQYCDQLENSQQAFQIFNQRWLLEIEHLQSTTHKKEAIKLLSALQKTWQQMVTDGGVNNNSI